MGVQASPQRGGWWRLRVGMREDREPALPPGALARPRMNTIELEREPYSDAYTDSTSAIARGSSRMFGPMRFMT